jgi:phage shock protein A
MGLLDRIGRVIRAQIRSLVEEAEDPKKILEQALMEMQQNSIQLRQSVAAAIASQKRTERQMAQNYSAAEQWYSRAQLALQKGDENLAREALMRRKSYLQMAQTLQTQLEEQQVIIRKLKEDMGAIDSKILEAKMKKDMYIARARSAVASQKMHEITGNINTSGYRSALERMEEKTMSLEAQNEVLNLSPADSLEQKFAALEQSDREKTNKQTT